LTLQNIRTFVQLWLRPSLKFIEYVMTEDCTVVEPILLPVYQFYVTKDGTDYMSLCVSILYVQCV